MIYTVSRIVLCNRMNRDKLYKLPKLSAAYACKYEINLNLSFGGSYTVNGMQSDRIMSLPKIIWDCKSMAETILSRLLI